MKTKLYLIIAGALILFSCEKNYVEPKPIVSIGATGSTGTTGTTGPTGPTATVFFKTDIEPLFQTNTCINCHPPTQGMDLKTGNAYASLMTDGTGRVDKTTPENSLIYKNPNPAEAQHTYKKLTAAEATKILTWIQEGALDN